MEDCTKKGDEDKDGLADCEDLEDCGQDPLCAEKICNNELGDDNDGTLDCDDPDCEFAQNCIKVENENNDNTKTGCSQFGNSKTFPWVFFVFLALFAFGRYISILSLNSPVTFNSFILTDMTLPALSCSMNSL